MEWLAKPPPTKTASCNTFVFGIHLGFETKQCFQAYLWSIDACAVWPLQHKDYICNNNHLIHTKRQHPTVCPQIFLPFATGCLLWISFRGDVRFPWDFCRRARMVRELRLDYGGHSFRWFDTDEMIRVHGSGREFDETSAGRGWISWKFVMNLSSVDYPPTKNASRKWWMIECEGFPQQNMA